MDESKVIGALANEPGFDPVAFVTEQNASDPADPDDDPLVSTELVAVSVTTFYTVVATYASGGRREYGIRVDPQGVKWSSQGLPPIEG